MSLHDIRRMFKKGISVCILAKDEEENIEECIKSVLSFADEIIVIDNASKDRTKELAESLGARVYTLESCSEAELRNFYLENVQYTWSLALDADERASAEFGLVLKEKIRSVEEDVVALKVPINNYFGSGKWASFLVFRGIRSGRGIFYCEGSIHPSIGRSVNSSGGHSEVLPAELHHLDALIKDRSSNKRERYMQKIRESIEKTSDVIEKNRLMIYLGLEYTGIGDFGKAEEIYVSALENLKKHTHATFARIFLIQNHMMQRKYSSAKEELNKLFGFDYNSVLFWADSNSVIEHLKKKNDITDAFLQFDEARYWCEINLKLWPFASYNYINRASLSEQSDEVDYLLEKAVGINPFLMSDLIYKQGYIPNLYIHQCSLLSTVEGLNLKDKFSVINNRL